MKRLVLFSHFDKKNRIDSYVIYYLNGLRAADCDILFITDGILSLQERKKINAIVLYTISGKHGEYDFGSYKRGFFYARDNGLLEKYQELILCNDSCYAPIYPFAEMFKIMDTMESDFWGVTHSCFGYIKDQNKRQEANVPHLQSYFLVFKTIVYNSTVFIDLLTSVTHEKDKMDVILKYEMKLTRLLLDAGFKQGQYIPEEIRFTNIHSVFIEWKKLIFDYRSPFLKYQSVTIGNADYSELNHLYPITLISQNIRNRFGLVDYLGLTHSRYYPLVSFFVLPFRKYKKKARKLARWILRLK